MTTQTLSSGDPRKAKTTHSTLPPMQMPGIPSSTAQRIAPLKASVTVSGAGKSRDALFGLIEENLRNRQQNSNISDNGSGSGSGSGELQYSQSRRSSASSLSGIHSKRSSYYAQRNPYGNTSNSSVRPSSSASSLLNSHSKRSSYYTQRNSYGNPSNSSRRPSSSDLVVPRANGYRSTQHN